MKRRSQSGLTMVEIAVVLAIVALLAAAAYPLISNILHVMTSKGGVEQVVGGIRLARQYAITQGQHYCIKFNFAGGKAESYTIGTASDGATCDQATVLRTDKLEITTLSTSFVSKAAPTSLIFDPVGNITNVGGALPGGKFWASVWVDTAPTSCVSSVGVTLFGGVRVDKYCQ